MSLTITKDASAHTALITGSTDSETIDVAAVLPEANDLWVVQIKADAGNDTVLGGAENDYIYASPGDDVANGGSNWDWLKFDLSSLPLTGTLSLVPGGASQSVNLTNGGTTTTLFTITVNSDGSFVVDGATPQIQAAFGRESATNVERIEFNLGGSNSLTVVNGTSGSDWLPGTPGDDVIHGFDGDDVLWGGDGGTNYLYGELGRDLFVGGPGIDHMFGGGGVDTASYQTSTSPVVASLADPSINTGDAAGDTYTDIRQLTGTLFGSTLYGDNTGQQNELFAIGGTNYLHGGTGYATLVSGPGDDHMFGGAGGGFADYETASGPVTASLAQSSLNTGEAAGDTYANVNDLGGSPFNDFLYGDFLGNNLVGNAGDDFMSGAGGNDTLTGGPGANTLVGGSGTDWFIFGGTVNSFNGTTHPTALVEARAGIFSTVKDFNQGNSGTYNRFEGDSIHLGPLVDGLFNHGTGPVDSFARIIEDQSNAFARLEVRDADGTWLVIAHLDGVPIGDIVGVVGDESGGVTNLPILRSAAPVDFGTHGATWPISGVGDFNADHDSDILWREPSTGRVDQWQMKNGSWGQSIDLGGGKGANWTLAGVGDFDGNGTSDILWRDIPTGKVDQWHMANGNWSQSIDLGGGKGVDWSLAGVADFNGDGTTDVLWRNVNTSQVDQWQMKNGNWSKSIDLGASKGADWIVAGLGDFNADGTSDVLWFNTVTGREEYWIMKNGNWAGSVDLGVLNASWKPSGVGDFNHDGASDALWLDPASGHVYAQLWMT